MKKPRKLYIVYSKQSGEDFAYNSIASIFDYHNRLKVTYDQLRKHFTKHVLFENEVCKIKKTFMFYGKDARKK